MTCSLGTDPSESSMVWRGTCTMTLPAARGHPRDASAARLGVCTPALQLNPPLVHALHACAHSPSSDTHHGMVRRALPWSLLPSWSMVCAGIRASTVPSGLQGTR